MFSFSWDDSFDINVSFQNATFLFNNSLIFSVSTSYPPTFLLFYSNTFILIVLLLEKWLYNCVSCFMFKRKKNSPLVFLSACSGLFLTHPQRWLPLCCSISAKLQPPAGVTAFLNSLGYWGKGSPCSGCWSHWGNSTGQVKGRQQLLCSSRWSQDQRA